MWQQHDCNQWAFGVGSRMAICGEILHHALDAHTSTTYLAIIFRFLVLSFWKKCFWRGSSKIRFTWNLQKFGQPPVPNVQDSSNFSWNVSIHVIFANCRVFSVGWQVNPFLKRQIARWKLCDRKSFSIEVDRNKNTIFFFFKERKKDIIFSSYGPSVVNDYKH